MTAQIITLLCFTFLAARCIEVWWQTDELPDAPPEPVYEPPFRQRGADLPKRPEGRHALKREIAQSVLVPAEPLNLKVRKVRPEWAFDTDAWNLAAADFFAGLPDDQAVQRPWVGAGVLG